jgi:antitoxin ParD1/3/4
METIKIALPEAMRSFVEKRAVEGSFSGVREYVLDVIRSDLRRRHEERIDELLFEGLASGEPIEVDEAYWQAKRERLVARLELTLRS